ncbi:MAG: phosphopentomutase [Acidobacteria bacterium]|nr:phosphopentomutase [Acidobacteriota bacterium]
MPRRAILIVLDSVGAGELPDAAQYGDTGSDTLGNIARQVPLALPTLAGLGLGAAAAIPGVPPPAAPRAAWGRMAERSAGKDSVTGHWELMGVVLDDPFPTFPHGFPPDLIAAFEARIGRPVLGNCVASGTAIIDALGDAHVATGRPIVYTSADSVFQIAAHEAVVPVAQLYDWCHVAYELAVEARGLGRVIARPFVGTTGAYARTANRHDYAMPPVAETLLDRLTSRGVPVTAVGKVSDLFAGRGVSRAVPTASDDDGVDALLTLLRDDAPGFLFVNLVDFDTKYGHRNDVAGYAANLERFDRRLPEVLTAVADDDLVIITADHGNDPTTPSTDHSREYVPLLVTARWMTAPGPLGVRGTFADVGQTLAAWFGVGPLAHGASFLDDLR